LSFCCHIYSVPIFYPVPYVSLLLWRTLFLSSHTLLFWLILFVWFILFGYVSIRTCFFLPLVSSLSNLFYTACFSLFHSAFVCIAVLYFECSVWVCFGAIPHSILFGSCLFCFGLACSYCVSIVFVFWFCFGVCFRLFLLYFLFLCAIPHSSCYFILLFWVFVLIWFLFLCCFMLLLCKIVG